jgi:hypothetical protein
MRTIVLPFWIAGASLMEAQSPTRDSLPPPHSFTLAAGFGNAMGWFGLQGEKYLLHSRLSAFAGLGYTPSGDVGDEKGTGIAVAGGLRAFTPGIKHRGFLELSVSQLAIERECFDACHRHYGPGIQAGYQFVSRGGFTLFASLGLGVLFSAPIGYDRWGGMAGLGMGYTWRRHTTP